MKNKIFVIGFFLLATTVNAQIEIAKIIGKDSKDYPIGFGAALNFGYPISGSSNVSLEIGAVIFPLKESDYTQGIVTVPLKLGYQYILNGEGDGFYIEPQVGYCVAGAKSDDNVDENIKGFVWAAGAGYIFPSQRRSQFKLGLRFESVKYNNGSVNFIALRFSQSLTFGKKD